jgi:predicted alpha/beta hydrolase family esterase
MTKRVLFVQGAGSEGSHQVDAHLVESLREHLGSGYSVRYPKLPNEAKPDLETWKRIIVDEVAAMGDHGFLVGHSIGASVAMKALADGEVGRTLAGMFLIAAPFWHDDKVWRWDEARLPEDLAARVPRELPLFLYQGREDEVVPSAHLAMYAHALPHAIVRRLGGRDHQLSNDLTEVARDLRSLG